MFGGKLKYYLLMHMVIFIWGFTGVLGKLLDNVPVHSIVFYRMLIGFLVIGVFMIIARKKITLRGKSLLKVSGTGLIMAAPWITFFASIYYSNVSFALVFFSTTALFTSFLEPILMKKKFNPSELIMAIVVVGGISIIAYDAMSHESSISNENLNYGLAIGCALASAFLAASFSVINAIFVQKIDSIQISFFELMSGCVAIGIVYFSTGNFSNGELILTWEELGMLLILGSVCTAFAFLLGNWLMKFITPFTMNLSVNMEPIYAILIAIFIFPDSEVMTPIFYIGAGIIIAAVLVNGILTSKRKKRRNNQVLDEPNTTA
jgi:drug/metabolite transporter (DMT)-like permease